MIINDAYVQETPSYEYQTEDGTGITWDLFVEAVDSNGDKWAHNHQFDMLHEAEAAQVLATKIRKSGNINPEHWCKGDCWEQYRTPQTWEQEKAAHLENEAFI